MKQRIAFTILYTPLGTPVRGHAIFDTKTTKISFPEDIVGSDEAWIACINASCTLDIRAGRKHLPVQLNGEWVKDWRRTLLAKAQASRLDQMGVPSDLVKDHYLWSMTVATEDTGLYAEKSYIHHFKTA